MDWLPQGTVTLLFTDIEGSTRLLHRLGERYGDVLADHQRLLRVSFAMHGGVEVDTQGDAFLVVFATAPDAVAAAVDAQRSLASHAWPEGGEVRVRIGLHTGAPTLRADGTGYVGVDVHRAARIAGAAHGGQVLLSAATLVLSVDALPEGVGVRDLGAHRLKDIEQPERLHQLLMDGLPSDFPPPKTLDAHPNNLPVQVTPLIGREREVMAVTETLLLPEVRLVTLTGPGGTGKTRLALAAAAGALDSFSDGVWFVPLAALTDPALVASAIAGALHVREAGGEPLAETLKAYLRDKEALLALDNFEQVVDAAPLVAALLAACPRVTVLATSRVPLRVYGEREYPVPPLTLPDPDRLPDLAALSQYEAVRLFIDRAVAVRPDFAVTNENAPAVAAICHRLDGLPLAIELAAARVRLLPPEALLERLTNRLKLLTGGARDLPARQQTLRGAIDWSHDLLDEEGRTLFRRLAVFAGGCTLEAVETVCDTVGGSPPGGVSADILDGVELLVAQSLLRREGGAGGDPRFGMLETIREYGTEMLEQSGEAEQARRSHADYFLALAEAAEPELNGPRQGLWLARLDAEHSNLRAALAWARERGAAEYALRLTGALSRFWGIHGHVREGHEWLESAMAGGHAAPPALRAKALMGVAFLAAFRGDWGRAADTLAGCIALLEGIGEPNLLALAHHRLAMAEVARGNYTEATARAERALAMFRDLGDRWGAVVAGGNLMLAAWCAGDLARAIGIAEISLPLMRELGDARNVVSVLNNLGYMTIDAGDHARAAALCGEALALSRDIGDVQGIAEALLALAAIATARARPTRAARLFAAVAAVARTSGVSPATFPAERALHERHLAAARAQLDPVMWDAAWAAGQALTLDEVIAYALDDTSA